MIKKYKKEIIIFVSFFLLYFTLGLLFSYYLGTYNFWNVAFDMDTPRVLGDLSLVDYNHYRATVHPLFIIFFQPIILFLNVFTKESILSVLLLQSFISSISVLSLYILCKKIGLKNNLNIILTLLFGLSLGQVVFTSNVETYIFAQLFLILLWLFVSYKMDKKLNYWDYIILIILGIGSLAITITNFIQFLIALFFLILLNKKEKHNFFTCCFVVLTVLSISVLLAEIQNIIWPSAPNFFTKNVTDFLNNSSEESLYIDKSLSFNKILNVINSNFAYSFNLSKLIIPATGVYLFFESSTLTNIISIILFVAFVGINIFFMYKSKFNFLKHKMYYALLLVYLSNFILHIFYGNSIAFLYICHYNFVIILLLAYILNYFKKTNITKKWLKILLISVIGILFFNICINMWQKLFPIYNPLESFRKLPIIILFVFGLILSIVIFKSHMKKIVSIIIIALIACTSWYGLNNIHKACDNSCDSYEKYEEQYFNYLKQLKEMKNSFSVRTYSEVEKPIGIYYFGMADRQKMLYKDGKLIDIKTKNVIKQIEYEKELIIPNMYTVVLKDKENNVFKIVENEEGIFFYKNNEKETLVKGNKRIELPTFDGYKYSEILKVLHQEILFNIDGDIPKPNIFGYTTAWYRDAMLATMVLEKTNNVGLLEQWVSNIDKIYDNSRDANINEADNLGELLYIIGATNVSRPDLINKIMNEIDRLTIDHTISGMVDGLVQTYYPTVLAIYGAKKNNINLNLIPPLHDDGYARLTWYFNNPIATKTEQNSSFYPYINWAFYHYSNYGSLYILDEIYPLSYEGGNLEETGKVESECFISDYYCNRNLYISHMWHASEMFLYLIEK